MAGADAERVPGTAAAVARAWRRFWFAPGSAANLGICRVIAVGIFFVSFDARGWGAWEGLDRVLWLPTPVFAALDLRPLSASRLELLALLCKGSLLLATVGLMTRTSAAVAAMSTFYLLGLRHNFGKIYYADAVVPLVLLVLAVARSGDRWSLDALLQRFRKSRSRATVPAEEYTWPVKLVWLLTVSIFFAAGVAKLRFGGIAWVFSDQLADVLIGQHHRPPPPPSRLGLSIAGYGSLCRALAGAVLALEVLSPLALLHSAARRILVPGLFVFTLSLPLLFGFSFTEYAALFVFWVPWRRAATAT